MNKPKTGEKDDDITEQIALCRANILNKLP